jgi:hypothetical protein
MVAKNFFALWRSSNPLVSLGLLAVVSTVFLTSRGMPWRGEWQWTLNWAAGTTILAGPVLAGLAAFEASRWRRVSQNLLLGTSSRRWAAMTTPIVGPLISAALVLVGAVVAAVALSAPLHPSDRIDAGTVPLALLALLFYAGLGGVIGRFLQPMPAAIAGVIAAYALGVASTRAPRDILTVGGSTGPLAGLTLDLLPYCAEVAWLVACIAVVTLLAARGLPPLRRVGHYSAGLLAVAAAAALLLNPTNSFIYRIDQPGEWRCAGAPLQTCLLAGNTRFLSQWSDAMSQYSAPFKNMGFVFPARYEQPLPSSNVHSTGVGELFFDPGRINLSPPTVDYVLLSLATPATCPQFRAAEPPLAALNARDWLVMWMRRQVDQTPTTTEDPRFATWAQAIDPDSQRTWARGTFDALRTCDLGSADIPHA